MTGRSTLLWLVTACSSPPVPALQAGTDEPVLMDDGGVVLEGSGTLVLVLVLVLDGVGRRDLE